MKDLSPTPEEVLDRLPPENRDNCEICEGRNGGVPGNENVVDGVVMCDYCHAEEMRLKGLDWRKLPPAQKIEKPLDNGG